MAFTSGVKDFKVKTFRKNETRTTVYNKLYNMHLENRSFNNQDLFKSLSV